MALQDLIGGLIQQSMAGQTQARLRSGAGNAGGGMEALRDALMGGGGPARGAGGGGGGGGLEDLLGAVLGGGAGPGGGGRPQGGAGGGGGLEDLLGAVLGGGAGGGARPPQPQAAPGSGDGLGGLLDALTGGAGGGGARGGAGGGLGDLLGAALGGGGGAASGGGAMGDLLGALLGGGRGAAGGGAMAILASLAMGALKSYMTQGGQSAAAAVSPAEARALVSADAERLILRAMIEAAKADGKIDKREIAKLVEKAGENGMTPEERAFVEAELARPIDLRGLAAATAGSPAMAAQVYAASVLAIDIDSAAEAAYLRDLAAALGLDPRAVAELHRMTGAPAV
jgi:uncharacterized membrane protein YebE (DUF533 family)